MRLLLLLFLIISFGSCKQSSAIGNHLSGSDSLQINFNEQGTNTIAKTLSTTEAKAINKLIHFVDSKSTEAYKCGYDGNLMFYKDGQMISDVAFNFYGDGCHHFIQEMNGELLPTVLSNEAVDFLKSLAEGKNWY